MARSASVAGPGSAVKNNRVRNLLGNSFALRVLPVVVLGVAAVSVLLALPPLPQPKSYHAFADQRTLLGVPHCLNVVSNLPFLVVGILGVMFVLRQEPGAGTPFLERRERGPFLLFFLGIGLTAFGSAYYHLDPNNDRLVWDRLPMAVAFMALSASVLGERIAPRLGKWSLPPLVLLGLASVAYWHWTEQRGRGDLRFYYFVQFYPMLALPLILALFPPRYTRTADLWAAFGWYVLAKILEHPGDGPIYDLGGWVSGHTLKHLAAALAAWQILRMLRLRKAI